MLLNRRSGPPFDMMAGNMWWLGRAATRRSISAAATTSLRFRSIEPVGDHRMMKRGPERPRFLL
jgi:hypothetical protein